MTAANLAVTHTPKVALSDKVAYAMGWVIQQTPNGTIVWHNGGTSAFGSYFGIAPDKHVGVVVLTNETNVGFPDAIGLWVIDRLLGNPKVDHVANASKAARATFERSVRQFARPDNPRRFPLAPFAGTFTNPGIGKASLCLEGDALALSLEPWREAQSRSMGRRGLHGQADATRSICRRRRRSRPLPYAFVRFLIDKDGRLNVLRLSFDDGQAYEFRRESTRP